MKAVVKPSMCHQKPLMLLNQARRLRAPGLEIALVRASVCVCVSVCVSTSGDINNQWRHMV